MEIVENKALKLKLRNPKRVTEVVPKSRILGVNDDGTSDVLVHWGVEEAQVLKNLRIKTYRHRSSPSTTGQVTVSRSIIR